MGGTEQEEKEETQEEHNRGVWWRKKTQQKKVEKRWPRITRRKWDPAAKGERTSRTNSQDSCKMRTEKYPGKVPCSGKCKVIDNLGQSVS